MDRSNSHYWESFKNIRPSQSVIAADKILTEHINLIRELFENFARNQGKTPDRWAKRLSDMDFTIDEVKQGVDRAVITCDRLPAYADLVTIIRTLSPRLTEVERDDKEAKEKAELLRTQTDQYLKMFYEKYEDEHLDKLLLKWWTGVYNNNCPDNYGLPLRTFLPIFFQDLVQAKGDIEKAIEIGIKKLE